MEQIINNNKTINKLYRDMITHMKENQISSFSIIEGKPKFKKFIQKVLDIAANRIYNIYMLEFLDYSQNNKKQITTSLYDSNEIDAHGNETFVTFSSGSNMFLKQLFKQDNYLTFSYNKSNKIRYDSNGRNASVLKNNDNNYDISNFIAKDEFVENDVTIKDYFIHLYLKDAIDLDFFLDALPHEISHCFGFEGGIYEGATETFNREICSKYNIISFPFAHPDETKFFQKLEKILGRDTLAQTLLTSSSVNHDLSQLIDKKTLNPETNNNWFERYMFLEKKYFKIIKKDKNSPELKPLKESLSSIMNKLNSQLDCYMESNPDKLFSLGRSAKCSYQDSSKDNQINIIINIQQKEIEMLQEIIHNFDKTKESSLNEFTKSISDTDNDVNIR